MNARFNNQRPAPEEKEHGASGVSRVIWVIIVFFLISAAAYYLNALING
ncbi:hypothetical protein ACT3TB_16335 [Micrococcaceae sp. AOP34-BR2-30]